MLRLVVQLQTKASKQEITKEESMHLPLFSISAFVRASLQQTCKFWFAWAMT